MIRLSLIVFLCSLTLTGWSQDIVISGTIKNPASKELSFTPTGGHPIVPYFRFEQYTADIGADGSFSIRLPADCIREWMIAAGKLQVWMIELAPGSHLHLELPAMSQLYNYTVTGDHADDVGFNIQLSQDTNYNKHYRVGNFNPVAAKADLKGTLAKHTKEAGYELEALEKYARTHRLSPEYYYYKRIQYRVKPYSDLFADLMFQADSAAAPYLFGGSLNNDSAAGLIPEYLTLVQEYIRWRQPLTPGAAGFKKQIDLANAILQGRTRQLFLTSELCYGKVPNYMDSSFAPYIAQVTDPVFAGILKAKLAHIRL